MSTEKDNAGEFSGWENTDSISFFEVKAGDIDPVKDILEQEDVKIDDKTPAKEEDKEAEKEPVFFEKEEEEEEDKDFLKEEKSETKLTHKSTLEFLKEKGLVSYELGEGEELTEAKAEEILEDSYEASVIEGVEDTIKSLPEELKDMIRFVNQGGDMNLLLTSMAKANTSGLTKDTDMTVEANQVLAVTMDLKEQGYDQEYIDAHIEILKDTGKLQAISQKAFDKISTKLENERKAEVDRMTQINKQRKEKAREYKANLSEKITTLDDVGGFKLTKEDKNGSLATYISDGTVTLKDGRVISEMQAALFDAMGDYEKTILLAKVLKSGFDFSSIANSAVTKAAKEVKKEIENSKNIALQSKGSSQTKARNLADLLGD